MALYAKVKNVWKVSTPEFKEFHRKRLTEWRAEDTTVRISKPTRIDKARAVGYRAKQGVIVVRQRVDRGGRMRPAIRSGRRTAHNYQHKNLAKNYQLIAEERANEKFTNCEVLNSYFVGKDGLYYWYEVILLDRTSPVIQKDEVYHSIITQTGRVYRGITSAARKSRGLRGKGFGYERSRPSNKAAGGHAN
ncbi:MAG TPA: 50S ribosomal protein L15e [Alphaproteobacteria bacterium]|nr:50S ribosomal protein L15e [Alphaproteobacteria bacterium]